MIEVLRKNWDFILYKQEETLILFLVNGQSSLSEVTYNLSAPETRLYNQEGKSFLVEKAQQIRNGLRAVVRIESCII